MKKAKLGMSALLLIGMIYTVLGGVFVVVGLTMGLVTAEFEVWLVGSIFAGIGSIFLILGVVFLVIELRKLHRANKLLENGRFLWAEVIECVPNYSVRINNRHPSILIVRYIDSRGLVHLFKSRSIRTYVDPSFVGRPVKVYYQDESYKHYYVDVDGVLPEIIEH